MPESRKTENRPKGYNSGPGAKRGVPGAAGKEASDGPAG